MIGDHWFIILFSRIGNSLENSRHRSGDSPLHFLEFSVKCNPICQWITRTLVPAMGFFRLVYEYWTAMTFCVMGQRYARQSGGCSLVHIHVYERYGKETLNVNAANATESALFLHALRHLRVTLSMSMTSRIYTSKVTTEYTLASSYIYGFSNLATFQGGES